MSSQQTSPAIIAQEKAIVRELVGLADAEEIVFNDVGWDSRAYLVGNGQFVFKFPRSPEAKRQYRDEVAACDIAGSFASDVLVPRVAWQHPDYDYIGFQGIVGTPLDTLISTLDASLKTEIGRALGAFLKQFHSCHLAEARVRSVEEEVREIEYKYEKGLPLLQLCLTDAEQSALRRLITEEIPAGLRSHDDPLVLCHSDLGYWNIIYSEIGGVGVIDFGDASYCVPARDFIGFDDPFILDAALHSYGDTPALRQQIALRQRVFPVLDLPFYIGKRDQLGIEKLILKIKAGLAVEDE